MALLMKNDDESWKTIIINKRWWELMKFHGFHVELFPAMDGYLYGQRIFWLVKSNSKWILKLLHNNVIPFLSMSDSKMTTPQRMTITFHLLLLVSRLFNLKEEKKNQENPRCNTAVWKSPEKTLRRLPIYTRIGLNRSRAKRHANTMLYIACSSLNRKGAFFERSFLFSVVVKESAERRFDITVEVYSSWRTIYATNALWFTRILWNILSDVQKDCSLQGQNCHCSCNVEIKFDTGYCA